MKEVEISIERVKVEARSRRLRATYTLGESGLYTSIINDIEEECPTVFQLVKEYYKKEFPPFFSEEEFTI